MRETACNHRHPVKTAFGTIAAWLVPMRYAVAWLLGVPGILIVLWMLLD